MNPIQLLDGAMGSELIVRGEALPRHIWSADTNLTNPELVRKIHEEYVEAGCNYITTNTFRTTKRSYLKLGLSQDEAINKSTRSLYSAVNLAKRANSGKQQILGSIAPLEDCYTPELFPEEQIAYDEFKIIGDHLIDAGVDILLLETMNSIIETKICLSALESFNIPIWVSFSLKNDNELLSSDEIVDALEMVDSFNVDNVLINCTPINIIESACQSMADNCKVKWGIYPNLGIGEPDPDGIIENISNDKEFIDLIDYSISLGASAVGGCCGSTPKHISLINKYINNSNKI